MYDLPGGIQWLLHHSVENTGAGRRVRYIHVGDSRPDIWTGKLTHPTDGRATWGTFVSCETTDEAQSGVPTSVQQHEFLVSADQLAAEPTHRDRVVDGTVIYAVSGWRQDAARATYRLTLRRLG